MFAFDPGNLGRIRGFGYDIWDPREKPRRMMYALPISGKKFGSAAVQVVGEDDQSLAPASGFARV